MRILHIQFAGPYTEGMNYQENTLPKYHAILGHEVFILTSCFAWEQGQLIHVTPEKKILNNGIILERMDYINLGSKAITERLRAVLGVKEKLEEINPDFIMLHDVQSLADYGICDYMKKHPNVRMIVDCHTDFSNSARNILSKCILHGIIWRHMAKKLNTYTEKFYGVLPARVDFLRDMYKLPAQKCDLLVMGADDELVEKAKLSNARQRIRDLYNIRSNDFLIVTGGKINSNRPETITLMKAINGINNTRIKMIVFGVVSEELKRDFYKECIPPSITFVGWLDSDITYNYMSAADLIVFPGLHSVMWEQAVGLGIPCVFRKIKGFEHVDLGGNAVFIDDVSEKSLQNVIESIVEDPDKYKLMKKVAEDKGIITFSYKEIARKCIDTSC